MPRTTGKKMRGKSITQTVQAAEPAYKPSLYLHGSNIPQHLKDVKPGQRADLHVQGKVVHRSEDPKGVSSVEYEVHRIRPEKPEKAPTKKK